MGIIRNIFQHLFSHALTRKAWNDTWYRQAAYYCNKLEEFDRLCWGKGYSAKRAAAELGISFETAYRIAREEFMDEEVLTPEQQEKLLF